MHHLPDKGSRKQYGNGQLSMFPHLKMAQVSVGAICLAWIRLVHTSQQSLPKNGYASLKQAASCRCLVLIQHFFHIRSLVRGAALMLGIQLITP